MPALLTVGEFVRETREDHSSPTTSTFVHRMPQCRHTISTLDDCLDSDRECLSKLKKAVKAVYSSGNSHMDSESYFSQALEKMGSLSTFQEQEKEVFAGFQKFSVVTKDLSTLMKSLMDRLHSSVLVPLDSLLKGDLKGAKGDMMRQFERARKEYEYKFNKIEKERKAIAKDAGFSRSEISPAEVADEMEKERKNYQIQACEYFIKVNEINTKKGTELLQNLVGYYHAQTSYFQEGLKTIEHYRDYFQELSVKLQHIRQREEMEKKKLTELRILLNPTMEKDLLHTTSAHAQPAGYSLHQLQGKKEHGTTKVGHLLKKSEGKMRRVWQRRRCEVNEGFLFISHSDENKPPTKINLLTSQFKTVPDDDRSFDLIACNRTYHFQVEGDDPASIEREREAWVSVLINCRDSQLKNAFQSNGPSGLGSTGKGDIRSGHKLSASLREMQQQITKQILKLPGNDRCVDCNGQNDSTWVSTNFGVVMCIECSGVHRDLGVHISRIQSLTLDHVGTAQLLIARNMTNMAFNEIMEAYFPQGFPTKPKPNSSMDEKRTFIRAKYLEKKYVIRTSYDHTELLTDLETAVTSRHLTGLLQAWAEGAEICCPLPSRPNEETALHLAVEQEDGRSLHIVDFLVQNAAAAQSVDIATTAGDTPLHLAVRRGQLDCMKLLLRSGADPNAENADGQSPLHLARQMHLNSAEELLNHALEGKKVLFENVTIDWTTSAQEEPSTDLSDDDVTLDCDFSTVTSVAGSRSGSVLSGAVVRAHAGGNSKGVARATSVVVPEVSPSQHRQRSQGDSGWPARPVFQAQGSSAALSPGADMASLKKRAAPRPPPGSSSALGFEQGHRRKSSSSDAGGVGIPSSKPQSLAGARLLLPPGSEIPPLKSSGGGVGGSGMSTSSSKSGLFNGQSVESLNSVLSFDDNPQPPPRKRGEPTPPRSKRCRALYDCDADNEDELTFREGDLIVITNTETDDENWLEGHLESDPSRSGLFPLSFVHLLPD